ncbi:MAG: phage holin family protein [Eubacteriales bacterium]|nr:phage holin family protein [Eubacteriales bacterium]
MPTDQYTQDTQGRSTFVAIVGRLIASAVVLAITAFFTPGFTIENIWSLIIAAVVLTVLDYIVAKLLKTDASPFGRGITGFILAAVVIYATKFIVTGYDVTLFGAILGAIIFGIADAIIPGRAL